MRILIYMYIMVNAYFSLSVQEGKLSESGANYCWPIS